MDSWHAKLTRSSALSSVQIRIGSVADDHRHICVERKSARARADFLPRSRSRTVLDSRRLPGGLSRSAIKAKEGKRHRCLDDDHMARLTKARMKKIESSRADFSPSSRVSHLVALRCASVALNRRQSRLLVLYLKSQCRHVRIR